MIFVTNLRFDFQINKIKFNTQLNSVELLELQHLCRIVKLNQSNLYEVSDYMTCCCFEKVENPLRIIYYKLLKYVSSATGTLRIIDMRKVFNLNQRSDYRRIFKMSFEQIRQEFGTRL